MIKKLKRLLEIITKKSPVLINPSLQEIRKKLMESKRHYGFNPTSLRFVICDDSYYVADATEWIHIQIKNEMRISPDAKYIFGEFTDDGYLWFYKYQVLEYFDEIDFIESPIELFEKTQFYKVVKPIIEDIEYQ